MIFNCVNMIRINKFNVYFQMKIQMKRVMILMRMKKVKRKVRRNQMMKMKVRKKRILRIQIFFRKIMFFLNKVYLRKYLKQRRVKVKRKRRKVFLVRRVFWRKVRRKNFYLSLRLVKRLVLKNLFEYCRYLLKL